MIYSSIGRAALAGLLSAIVVLAAQNLGVAQVSLSLSQNTISFDAGETREITFSNSGSSNGRYQMSAPGGLPSWVRITNDNNNVTSGTVRMTPDASVSGTFDIQIRACRYLSSSDCDTKTLTVILASPPVPLEFSVGSITVDEGTPFSIPVSISGGAPGYTGEITGGAFPFDRRPSYSNSFQQVEYNGFDISVPTTSTYNFRLTIRDSAGESKERSFSVTIRDIPPPPDPPSVAIETQSATSIRVFWGTVRDSTNFEVERSSQPASGFVGVFSGDSRSFVDEGLDPDTEYFYRVRVTTPAGTSIFAPVISATTAPAAPRNYAAWAEGIYGAGSPDAQRAPEHDGNFDGVTNVAAYLTGLDPNSHHSPSPITQRFGFNGDTVTIEFSFRQPKAVTDIALSIGVTDSLDGWRPLFPSVDRDDAGEFWDVTVTALHPRDPRLIVRLEASVTE